MSLKGRGQGVDLGTSTLSFIRSIICSLFGRDFPYDPLNRFPFFVFLSPRPHSIGAAAPEQADGVSIDVALINHLAATVHRCIALAPLAIDTSLLCCLLLALRFMHITQQSHIILDYGPGQAHYFLKEGLNIFLFHVIYF